MSHLPIALRSDVQRLIDEKYEVTVYLDYLLVESIPYVTPNCEVAYGILVCPYSETGKPDHTVYFKGETPCNKLGQPLNQLINNSETKILCKPPTLPH